MNEFEIREMKKELKTLRRYKEMYPNGASGCCCLFDDDFKQIQWCEEHSGMKEEIESLKKDLALNASMLARQCDMARDAESERLSNIINRQHADCERLTSKLTAQRNTAYGYGSDNGKPPWMIHKEQP